jgi:hypothetical protein
MANWRKMEPKVWGWRIRGKSTDNQTVTLGKFNTKEEAIAEHDVIVKDGFYRNVTIEQIIPKPRQEEPPEEPRPGNRSTE